MASETGTEAEYGRWWEAVCSARVCAVQLNLRALQTVYVRRFAGSKINGALWAGLSAVAERHPDATVRSQARRALSKHIPSENRAGFAEKRLVLGLPAGPLYVRPGESFSLSLILFGDTAETWPAWVLAAERLNLQPGCLELVSAAAITPVGPRLVSSFSDPSEALTTLGALAGIGAGQDGLSGNLRRESWEVPAQEDAGPALGAAVTAPGDGAPDREPGVPDRPWRLVFETPVVLEARGETIWDVPTAEPLIVSALSSLGAVGGARPGVENTRRLRALAAQTPAAPRQLRRVRALHHRGHDVYGLTGELFFTQLPATLREILWLAQFTHLGQLSAFGLGRFTLRPVGAV
jgi:hypothetical protein